ncbi:hypothetical protein [Methylomusa anaerophila]|nr:hypothetical protein [Methylomusa anaerophila]
MASPSGSVLLAVIVIATPGAILLPSGVRVMTGVVGAELVTVKEMAVQSE